MKGGLFDALTESGGDMFAISNEEAMEGMVLFERTEGIDIEPAAGVAVASLKQAIRTGAVETDAVIMLNITGGGIAKFKKENKVVYKQPDCVFALDTDPDTIKETVMELFI